MALPDVESYHVDSWVCVPLPKEEVGPGCTMGRRQACGGMLWTIFSCETLGPSIHADVHLTWTTYLNIIADQVHPFMAMVFLDGSGLFQDNAPLRCLFGLQIHQISIQSTICGMCWTIKSDLTILGLHSFLTIQEVFM